VSAPNPDSGRPAIRDAVRALAAAKGGRGSSRAARASGRAITSDLSIDEALVLHSVGWEPVELVCGAGVYSVPQGSWQWAVGEITGASYAAAEAMAAATRRMEGECRAAGGAGVVGVRVGVSIEHHAVNVVLVGTAVSPSGGQPHRGAPFVSDLSGRDFALLHNAGWQPCGLAYGSSFVHVPRRSAGTAIAQSNQNVELTNFTQAMYAARESAMERMQASALQQKPMSFASHAVGFTTWGTAVQASPGGHRYLQPQVAVPLDDAVVQFAAQSMRGD
jgi:uncharacterized protein YbjQ (UPF0145 family)